MHAHMHMQATVEQEMEAAYVQADQTRLRKSHIRHPSLGSVPPSDAASDAGQAGAPTDLDAQGDLLRDTLNISHVLTDAAAAIVDDSFLKCFTSAASAWVGCGGLLLPSHHTA